MESAEREYLAMAKARISGSAPWTAKTSVWLRAAGAEKDSLDMSMVSRTEYGIREWAWLLSLPANANFFGEQNAIEREHPGRGSSHAGVFSAYIAQAAAFAGGALGNDPAMERSAFCALADSGQVD